MDDYQKKLDATKRIVKKLNITQGMLMELLDAYNTRITELNNRIFEHCENFLTHNIVQKEDGSFEYILTEDDASILEGFKKQNEEILEKEFPQLFEVMDDLRIFEE